MSVSPLELFPRGRFSPPATEAELAGVERELGVCLPASLRGLYFVCDGFREELGNAKYLLSLRTEDTIGSLLTTTRYYWQEWPTFQPTLDLSGFVFFGFSSGDEAWGIDWRTGDRVIAYHPSMGGEAEVVGVDIAEVWRADRALCGG